MCFEMLQYNSPRVKEKNLADSDVHIAGCISNKPKVRCGGSYPGPGVKLNKPITKTGVDI